MTRGGNKAGADQLGEGVRHTAVEQPQLYCFPPLYKVAGQRYGVGVGARQVLHLHQSAGPAPRAVGPIKLQQPPAPSIGAHGRLDSVIFFGAGLAQLLPDFQHPARGVAGDLAVQQARYGIFAQFFLQPLHELF